MTMTATIIKSANLKFPNLIRDNQNVDYEAQICVEKNSCDEFKEAADDLNAPTIRRRWFRIFSLQGYLN